ncbi:MAG: lactococcin 972 family bacteriocin [Nocardioides sp.]
MRTFQKASLNLLGSAALVLASAAPALATVEYPGGGTWSYGVGSEVYSHYHHPSRTHRASVINGYGELKRDCAPQDYWARASLRSRPWVADRAYWSRSC